MYKILVPVDFSEKSKYAVKMAAKIGKNIEAEIYLLHLVELPSGIVDMGSGSNFSIPESMMYLRKVKEKILDLKDYVFLRYIKLLDTLLDFKTPLKELEIL